jgi:hypothetical protein
MYIRAQLFTKKGIIDKIVRILLNENDNENIESVNNHENENEKNFENFVFHVFRIEVEGLRGNVEKIEALSDMNYRYALGLCTSDPMGNDDSKGSDSSLNNVDIKDNNDRTTGMYVCIYMDAFIYIYIYIYMYIHTYIYINSNNSTHKNSNSKR